MFIPKLHGVIISCEKLFPRQHQVRLVAPKIKPKLPGNSDPATYDAKGKLIGEKSVEARDESSGNSDNAEQENEQEKNQATEQEAAKEEQQLAQQALQIKELKARDTEVRVHEQAHAAVGGQHAGSPSYEYQRGPDGTNYAVGGEVQIDVGAISGDPQATIEKMQTVRAAALAPAQPSGADRAIAADATQKIATAQAELASPKSNEDEKTTSKAAASLSSNDSSEEKTAKSAEQTRDTQVEARAGRIANFYQMATSPASNSGFSAQI